MSGQLEQPTMSGMANYEVANYEWPTMCGQLEWASMSGAANY